MTMTCCSTATSPTFLAKGQAQTGVSIVGPGQVVPQPIEVAYAELCTSRLMTNNSPRLLVKRHEDGGTVIDFPLNNYLLLMRSDRYSKMGDQEYLDRESRWTLYFSYKRAFGCRRVLW